MAAFHLVSQMRETFAADPWKTKALAYSAILSKQKCFYIV